PRIKVLIYIVASETPCRYDRFVSLAGGQAEIAPGANPGSKIRGFGSSKHLDEGHQSRARASLRAGTSRLTERGEKGGKNDEMTRVGAILRDHGAGLTGPARPGRYRGSTTAGTAGRKYSITRFKQSARFRGKRFFVELLKSDKARIRLREIAISLAKDLAVRDA
ncbi:hypothetical protein ALC60_10264, partial [Trachymyrmex zeteki]